MLQIGTKLLIYGLLLTIIITTGILFIALSYMTKSVVDEKKRDIEYFKKYQGLSSIFLKKNWYRTLDKYLKESGYVVTPIKYILVSMLLLMILLISFMQRGIQGTSSIMFVVFLLFILLNLIVYQKTKDRQNKIKLELCNIQDIMYFQTKIGTAEDVVLTHASRVANAPLKEPLEILATAPKVKKSMTEALEVLRGVSNLVELQSFSFILEQRSVTGRTEESHKAQALQMKRNKRLRRRIDRQYKRTKLIIASLLLFICYMLMLTVPVVIEMLKNLDLMFR